MHGYSYRRFSAMHLHLQEVEQCECQPAIRAEKTAIRSEESAYAWREKTNIRSSWIRWNDEGTAV
jgi:hypothetical protein